MNINRIIIFWGILDICSIGWYFLWKIFHRQVPIYSDILQSFEMVHSMPYSIPIIITVISSLLYLTLIPSGYLLYKQKPIASKIVYFQTPFRLITLLPPSVFFVSWPLKHIFEEPGATSALITLVILLILSESLKISSVISWRKQLVVA